MNLSDRRAKTVLRTVRLSEELDAILEKDAKAKKTSVNGLMAAIMTKYAEWDRFADRFGHICIPATMFRALLDLADENALATLAERLGIELTNELVSFWYKKISLETLLQLISDVSEYGNLGELEVENEGRNYTISIYHEYGKKWSRYLEHYADKMIRYYLKVIPQFETTENTLTLKFQAP